MAGDHLLQRVRSKAEAKYVRALMAHFGDRLEGLEALGFKIISQHKIHRYRVDFGFIGSDGRWLVVEIDGKSHARDAVRDQQRDEMARMLGYSVIRFENEDVFTVPKYCVKETVKVLRSLTAKTATDIESLDAIYRNWLIEHGYDRSLTPAISKITVLNPSGDNEAKLLFVIVCDYRHRDRKKNDPSSEYFRVVAHDRSYRELHLKLSNLFGVLEESVLRRMYLRLYLQHRRELNKNMRDNAKDEERRITRRKERASW